MALLRVRSQAALVKNDSIYHLTVAETGGGGGFGIADTAS